MVKRDYYWLRHLPVKHHEDATGQDQGVVGEGKEGGLLLSFRLSADGDFVRMGRKERERGVNKNTELPTTVAAAEQRQREG